MRAFAAAAIAATLLATSGGAQDIPTITEAEFLAALDAAHPAVIGLREDLGRAEAAVLDARAFEDPELGISHETPGDAEQVDLTLAWRPPDPGRRRLTVAAAGAAVGSARARLAASYVDLRGQMREAYAQWAVASAASGRLALQAAEVERLARRERQRAVAGEASGLAAGRLALAAGEARVELARAEAERLRARAHVTSWQPDLPAAAAPELPPLPEPTGAPVAEHPRLVALRAELEAARLAERLAGRSFEMPQVVGGWQRHEERELVAEGPILGLVWPLPLLDRRRGDRAAARARVEAAEAHLAVAERDVAAALAGSRDAYEALAAAARAARETAAVAPSLVTSATAAFEAGELGLTDLLETRRAATAAELAALDLHAEALSAHRELERALADAANGPPGEIRPLPESRPSNGPTGESE